LGDRQPVWVNRMSDEGDADPLQNLTDWEEKYRPWEPKEDS